MTNSSPQKPDDPTRGLTPVQIAVAMLAAAGLFAIFSQLPSLHLFASDPPRHERALTDLATLKQALKLNYVRTGTYPPTAIGLRELVSAGALEKVPVDPWGREYLYSNALGRWSLVTFGKDGVPGGEGEDADIVEFHPSGVP
jgi:general secretion pathway protein G